MKWIYSIKNKFVASAALLALCLLVLLGNFLSRIHTRNVQNYIATLYEDRLIAEVYILKMTNNIYQIREALHSDLNKVQKSNAISKLIDDFNDTYNTYIKTKLTTTEKATSIELISYIKNFDPSTSTEKALFSLNKLSAIQLEESKLIMKGAESEYASIKATSQFAYATIIIILLVLQAMVFSAKTLTPINNTKDPTLN
jgi:hypothetical protein